VQDSSTPVPVQARRVDAVTIQSSGLPPSVHPDRPKVSVVETWTVREYDSVTSTNLVAANLPAWHAVRADTQTSGRGRFQRSWTSNAGGLWLTAVVPLAPHSTESQLAPLMAGLAVCEALRSFGLEGLRLRWPNDVLAGQRKLAGLLIDQFIPGLAAVGIGINVTNRPEESDPLLQGQVARLADLVPFPSPALGLVMSATLRSLKAIWTEVSIHGGETVLPRINALWQTPRTVQLDLDGRILTGEFQGVDVTGRLGLRSPDGNQRFFAPHEVRCLRDIN
jgi:BirA family transcriptional regulator, biotin operon repressor / biotin---[acetyl-CoA-carboxylase] ligase